MLTSVSLEEYAERAQAGDPLARVRLAEWAMARCNGWVAFLVRRTGSRGLRRELYDECRSDVWPLIEQALRYYQPGRSWEPYLRHIAWRRWLKNIIRPRLQRGTARNPARFSDLSERDWEYQLADNRSRGAVGSEHEYTDRGLAVRAILEKMPAPLASLLRVVYGISNGEPKRPVRVRDLERLYGTGRNVISKRVAKARHEFARLAIAAGLDN